MIRLVFYCLILLIVIRLLRSVIQAFMAPPRADRNSRESPPVAELVKDPVCGAYVPAATSLSSVVKGKTVYFCSEECRSKHGR